MFATKWLCHQFRSYRCWNFGVFQPSIFKTTVDFARLKTLKTTTTEWRMSCPDGCHKKSGWRLSSPSSKCFIHSLVKFRSQTVPKGWAPFNWLHQNFPPNSPERSSGPQSDYLRCASLWIADSWNIGMNLHFSSGTTSSFQGPLVHFPSYKPTLVYITGA